MNFYQSLHSNTVVPTHLDGRSFLIVGKETPANPGRFEQSMQDTSGRGGRVSAAPNEDGEKMRRDYEFRIATMQSRIAGLEREIEDGDVRTRQLELSDQRIKQLEDDLDKFRRVSLVMNSAPILSSFLRSGPRNKALQCYLSRKRLTTCVKTPSAREIGKYGARDKMKRSYKSCANVASD
jgi:hypothetical protein